MTEDVPELEPEPLAVARPKKVARDKPHLNDVSVPLRELLGYADDASTLPVTANGFYNVLLEKLPQALLRKDGKGTLAPASASIAGSGLYESLLHRAEEFVAAAEGQGRSSGSGGQTSGEGGAAGSGGARNAAARAGGGEVGGGSGGAARAGGAVAPGAGGGAGGSSARPAPARGGGEYLRIAHMAIVNGATAATKRVSDRLTQTARTAPPTPPTMEFAAGHADAVLKQVSPRYLEGCDVDALAAQMRHLAPPSGDGGELKAVLGRVLTVRVHAQREAGVINSIRGLAVRKTSAGEQHTPNTPEVTGDYLRQRGVQACPLAQRPGGDGGARARRALRRGGERAATDGAPRRPALPRQLERPVGSPGEHGQAPRRAVEAAGEEEGEGAERRGQLHVDGVSVPRRGGGAENVGRGRWRGRGAGYREEKGGVPPRARIRDGQAAHAAASGSLVITVYRQA